MKKMKKAVLFALVISILIGCAGCGDKGGKNSSESDVPVLSWYVPGSKQADIATVMAEANKKLVEDIGCKLDLQFIDGGAFTERMNMMMASGAEFDLCFTGYVNPYIKGIEQQVFEPLSELMDKEAPLLKDALPDYLWDAATVNGEIYAVPNLQILASATALIAQKEYVDKYNFDLDAVKNIDDIEPFLEVIKQNEPNLYAYSPENGVGPWVNGIEEPMGTYMVIRQDDPQCKVYKRYETPEYLNAVNTLRDWYNKGYIRKDIASATGNSDKEKSAFWSGSYKPGLAEDLKKTTGKEVVVKVLSPGHITSNMCVQTMIAISNTTQDKVKAVKLIEKLNTDIEFYNLIANGIEGKHYTKTDDIHISRIDDSGYTPNADWMFGNQFNAYLLEGKADDTWEQTQALNDNATKSRLLGFSFNSENVINQLSQCEATVSEFSALENGSMDPEVIIPQFAKKMEDAGFDKAVNELQKQIDEFLASK